MVRISKLKNPIAYVGCMLIIILATASVAHAGASTYIYDELDRLKEVVFPDGRSLVYNYDELGNLMSKTGGLSPCPTGYALDQNTGRCEKDVECPAGYDFNESTNQCESGSRYSYNPTCSFGNLNPTTKRCEKPATATTIGASSIPVYSDCPSGAFSSDSKAVCFLYTSENSSHPYLRGYLFPAGSPDAAVPLGEPFPNSGQKLEFSSNNPVGYLSSTNFSGALKVKEVAYIPGYHAPPSALLSSSTANGYLASSPGYGGITTYSCSSGTLSGTTCWTQATCPEGGTLEVEECVNDTFSQTAPICSEGTFDGSTHSCYTDAPITVSTSSDLSSFSNDQMGSSEATKTRTYEVVPMLSVNKTGEGSGTVTSSPVGIDCGEHCNELYSVGTQVTLTAVPQIGSLFNGWSGGNCSGIAECIITMSENTSVSAEFIEDTQNLIVNPGFDMWTDIRTPEGWQEPQDWYDSPACRVTTKYRSAPYSVRLVDDDERYSAIEQVIPVTGDTAYRLTAWSNALDTDSYYYISVDNATTHSLIFSERIDASADAWEAATVEFATPVGCDGIRIRFEYGDQTVMVDDVTLYEIPMPCPDPADLDDDNDGVLDEAEVVGGTCNRDSDGDGIEDGVEDTDRNGRQDDGETDPSDADSDTDGDGFSDGYEAVAGTDPTDSLSFQEINNFIVDPGFDTWPEVGLPGGWLVSDGWRDFPSRRETTVYRSFPFSAKLSEYDEEDSNIYQLIDVVGGQNYQLKNWGRALSSTGAYYLTVTDATHNKSLYFGRHQVTNGTWSAANIEFFVPIDCDRIQITFSGDINTVFVDDVSLFMLPNPVANLGFDVWSEILAPMGWPESQMWNKFPASPRNIAMLHTVPNSSTTKKSTV